MCKLKKMSLLRANLFFSLWCSILPFEFLSFFFVIRNCSLFERFPHEMERKKLGNFSILDWLVFLMCEQHPNHYESLDGEGSVEMCGWVSWCFVCWNEVEPDLYARPLLRRMCKVVLHLEPLPSMMSLASIPDRVRSYAHRAKYSMSPRKFSPRETQPKHN